MPFLQRGGSYFQGRRGQNMWQKIGRKVGGVAAKIGGTTLGKMMQDSSNPLAQIGGAILTESGKGVADALAEDPPGVTTLAKEVDKATTPPILTKPNTSPPADQPVMVEVPAADNSQAKPKAAGKAGSKRKAAQPQPEETPIQKRKRLRGKGVPKAAQRKYFSIF